MLNNSHSRVLGIDLLKIVAMILIIVGHLIAQYGIGTGWVSMSSQRYTVILLGIISSSAVNCYALCTGFLMINRNTRLSRLLELWFQIIFYSVGITLLFFILMRYHIIPHKMDISAVQWLTSVTPIIRNSWWYASCYFGLYILIPIINPIIKNTSRETLELFLFISIGLASFSALLYGDGLCLKYGYSIIWLVILYILGAYVRIYNIKCNRNLLKWGRLSENLK